NRTLWTISPQDFSPNTVTASAFKRLWEREFKLSGSVLFLNERTLTENDRPIFQNLLEDTDAFIILSVHDRWPIQTRPMFSVQASKPVFTDQLKIWKQQLSLPQLNGELETMVSSFHLGIPAIESI